MSRKIFDIINDIDRIDFHPLDTESQIIGSISTDLYNIPEITRVNISKNDITYMFNIEILISQQTYTQSLIYDRDNKKLIGN